MRMPRRLLLALLALLVVALAGPVSADVAPEPAPTFVGTFRYAGDAREDADRRAAIDRGVARLFFAFRPIARWRLSEATKVISWLSVTFADGQIRTRGADGLALTSPDDGTEVPFAFRGERYRVTQRLRGFVLVQTMAADGGTARNEWALSPDGSTLTGKITISSPHLPVPIAFTLTYKRSS
jgi:hypothetical protein